ncbi:hypothetical protein POKO110462_17800 [Pontibacter korlensis]
MQYLQRYIIFIVPFHIKIETNEQQHEKVS